MSSKADYLVEHWSKADAVQNYLSEMPVEVEVDDRAATRRAIISRIQIAGYEFHSREDWNAKLGKASDGMDWDYRGIALHHAGNSFSCDANDVGQLRKAEQIDMGRFGHLSYHYAISCDGAIYEALDIREKGAHISIGNTGIIGVVMLADFSTRGEAYKEEYSGKSILNKLRGVLDWGPDLLAAGIDEPREKQIEALFALVNTLKRYFAIEHLGGHREYEVLATGVGRACPGVHGMVLAEMLRKECKLKKP